MVSNTRLASPTGQNAKTSETSETTSDKCSRKAGSSSPATSVASTGASSGRSSGIISPQGSPSLLPTLHSLHHRGLYESNSEAGFATWLFKLTALCRDCHGSLESALSTHVTASETEAKQAVRRLLKSVCLLKSCDYDPEDIQLVVAHAAIYLRRLMVQQAYRNMNIDEASFVACLLVFLAHSHLLDETCPLIYWHKHIFVKYCSIKILNKALMTIFRNLSFKLRVEREECEDVFLYLSQCFHSGTALGQSRLHMQYVARAFLHTSQQTAATLRTAHGLQSFF
eukprot:gnl/TRDRNA2_/TRDRNA2_173470_c0_seq23.p1 gnl/TRDRNA2_/TRDRNA2_173470_c0~~gnl/TRDRNA2_/TRDRNA2_173470_c0_seq23.p1  ORF type:complete len:283 (+),score=36.24 gnl/TRDRNA2_/TRDRNA2_173470_c0_seq23:116-964(+)